MALPSCTSEELITTVRRQNRELDAMSGLHVYDDEASGGCGSLRAESVASAQGRWSPARSAASEVAQAVLENELASVVYELRASRAREAALEEARAEAEARAKAERRSVERRLRGAMDALASENADLVLRLRRAEAEVEALKRADARRTAKIEAWTEALQRADVAERLAAAAAPPPPPPPPAVEDVDEGISSEEEDERTAPEAGEERRRRRPRPRPDRADPLLASSLRLASLPSEGVYTLGGYAPPRRA